MTLPTLRCAAIAFLLLSAAWRSEAYAAPAWVEYPAHPATYGDHTINATWVGGPVSSVQLQFSSDESILHGDGVGQSQRTARNTLTHTPPADATNPQDFDVPKLVANYGGRLPLLQQMSANGTSGLTYRFSSPVDAGFDLFVTDIDTSDAATVAAFGPGGLAIDMLTWQLIEAGDLSTYKNTGTGFSSIVAPLPLTTFATNEISFTAADATNYNRTYAILRAPAGTPVESVSISFAGIQNSASRAAGATGSHIYLALASLYLGPDFNRDGDVDGDDLTQWRAGFGVGELQVQGDATGDGAVDGVDLLIWQRQLVHNSGTAPATTRAPEPKTGLLAALLVGKGVIRSRRRNLKAAYSKEVGV